MALKASLGKKKNLLRNKLIKGKQLYCYQGLSLLASGQEKLWSRIGQVCGMCDDTVCFNVYTLGWEEKQNY